MGSYDENLYENVFFNAFSKNQSALFENAIKKKWIIAIPRQGTFTKSNYDDLDYFSHVLVPVISVDENERNECHFKTLGNQKVIIKGKTLLLWSKDSEKKIEIQILFDETFYNESDEAYQVICIEEPLAMDVSDGFKKKDCGKLFSLNSVEQCTTFLWKFVAKVSTQMKIDELISLSRSQIQSMEPVNIDSCFSIMRNLYVASYNIITSHKTYTKISSRNDNIQNSLKLALEMYLCHHLSNALFWALTDVSAEKDVEVNKAARRYQQIGASKSGIRFDICENIPRARKELLGIRFVTTPVGICECIRKVISEVSLLKRNYQQSSGAANALQSADNENLKMSVKNNSIMVTSDDLLSALIFLIIKSDIPNWYAYLEFSIKFRFASCSRDDEYQYYLTTMEAALEHIRGMANATNLQVEDMLQLNSVVKKDFEESTSSWIKIIDPTLYSSSRLGATAYQLNKTRHLFQLIESGQTSAVQEMLERLQNSGKSQPETPFASLKSQISSNSGETPRQTVGPANFAPPTQFKSVTNNSHHCHPLCNCRGGGILSLAAVGTTRSLMEGFRRSESNIAPVVQGSRTFDSTATRNNLSISETDSYKMKNGDFNYPNVISDSSILVEDERGWNALHVASWYGQLEIVKILCNMLKAANNNVSGQKLNLSHQTLDTAETALHLAAKRGHQNVLAMLLESESIDLNVWNSEGQTALHLAVEHGYLSCVSTISYYAIRNYNVVLNAVDSLGNNSLHLAAMWGYDDIVHYLLENKISVVVKNNKGKRPFEVASTRHLIRLLKIRCLQQEKSMQMTTAAPKSEKPVENRSTAKVSSKTAKQKQRLDKWSSKSNSVVVDAMNTNSAATSPDNLGRKIEKLLKVVADGDTQMLNYLLEIKEDDYDMSPIDIHRKLCHPLCQCNLCNPVQKFIIKSNSKSLSVNSKNKEGFHCLHIAAIHDRSTIAKFLLNHGADPNSATYKLKLTPLHLAAIYGSLKVLLILLGRKDVDLNGTDKKLNTPLFYACGKGKYEIAQSLIKNGASVCIANCRGNTPLHEAVRNNHTEIINLLLDNGADISTANHKGLTPIDLTNDLALYVRLKKLSKSQSTDNVDYDIGTEVNVYDTEFVSINTDFLPDDDNQSMCSETSVVSSLYQNEVISEDRPLFSDEQYQYLSEFEALELNHNADNSDFAEVLDDKILERVDKNSKYNYRLIFKDPNSPSISSANSN